MPYIQRERRDAIRPHIQTALEGIGNPGDLNYAISLLCMGYLRKWRPSYARFNSVMGVLQCAALEMYRAQVAPYEDRARAKNGAID